MKLPEEVRPIWRTIQVLRIGKGLDDGLRIFIVGPFFYEIFKNVAGEENALLYTSIIWAIYCGLIALLEIPTGALADVFGRTRIIIACTLLNMVYGICLACLIFFKSLPLIFTVAILAFTIRAFAYALFNGSYSAWVVDSINEACPGFGYERLLARGYAYSWWAQIVGGILGVTMYLQGIPSIAFVVGAMICLSTATYCIAEMRESSSLAFVSVRQTWGNLVSRLGNTIRTGFNICQRNPVLWWLLAVHAAYDLLITILAFLWPVAMGALFGSTKWSVEWYFMVFSVPMVAALGAHLMAWSGDKTHASSGAKMSNKTLRWWLTGGALCASLPIIALGYLTSTRLISFAVFAMAILLVQLAYGAMEPCYNTLLNNYVPVKHSQERATVMSIGGMINGLLLLVLMIPSSGRTGATSPYGWILPAIILLVVLLLANYKIKKHEKADLLLTLSNNAVLEKEEVYG